MLQLILGIAGTGKTTWILQQMQERAKLSKYSILLVPEQFSSSAETLVLEELGDAQSAFVDVLSFRTLADRLLRGADENLHLLSDAGRAVCVKRALKTAQGKLKRLARSKQDTAFCNLCAQTIAELKTAGATPESLEMIALKTQDAKFLDIATLFSAYEAVLAGSAMDPEDRLLLASKKAGQDAFFEKTCYIDNFDGFTAPEYTMLCCLIQYCEAVCVSLCCDGLQETENGLGLFSPSRSTAQRLINLTNRLGVSVLKPCVLHSSTKEDLSELCLANLQLAGQNFTWCKPQGQLTFTQAADRHEEVKLVAAEMVRLASQGASYSKMAIICRDVSLYESIVRREMMLFNIPWHSDTPDTIEFSASVCFFRAALKLLWQGIGSEPILELLKTGLCGFSQEALSALENYVYTWQPKAANWKEPFAQNPHGFLRDMDDFATHSLALAEEVRAEILPKLEAFIRNAKGKNARNFSMQLYYLLESVSAPEHHEEKALLMEKQGDFALAERSRRTWDLSMDMLDEMAALLVGEAVSAAEYDELLLLLVRSTDFGQVPKTLESVPFAGADRARLASPDHCFVLGLLDGEFPAKVGYSGLLTHSDRDMLVDNNIEMPGSFQNRILLEKMFLYRTLTAARKSLHLSYPLYHEGVMGVCCEEVSALQAQFHLPPLVVDQAALSPTKEAAFDRVAMIYREHSQESADILQALSTADEYFATQHLPLLDAVNVPAYFGIHETQILHELTGGTPRISPTRVERYFNCRFAYLMEHVLRVRTRRKAEFSALESGSLVHYVLEQVLRELKNEFANSTDDDLLRLTKEHCEQFASANFPDVTARLHVILGRIQSTVFSLLQYLRAWAQNSSFETQALELGIGDTEVAPLTLQTESGKKVQVVGKVDRVDVFKKEGKTYFCILDYKTGSQSFSLAEVLYGLNLQMLVYMDALCRQKKGPYKDAIPAGVLYLSADPSPKSESRRDVGKSAFGLDGLLLDDADILQALDRDKSGLFLPLRYKKDGNPSGNQLATLERIGGLSLHVESLIEEMAEGISGGDFSARPLVRSSGRKLCPNCPYFASCRHEDGVNEVRMNTEREYVNGRLEELDRKGAEERGQ